MNLILVVIDSLRADHVGCYGNKWIRTPNLDALAKESVVFTQAYPESLPTIPVRRALWTGHTVFPFKEFKPPVGPHPRWLGWEPLADDDVIISELLCDKGYVTSFITDTYHMFKPSMNFHRGFMCWRWIRGQERDAYSTAPLTRDYSHLLPRGAERPTARLKDIFQNTAHWQSESDRFAPQVFQEAMDWIEENHTHDKFFMLVDSFDPHEPWNPPQYYVDLYDPGYKGRVIIDPPGGDPRKWMTARELKHVKALYAGEVTMVDRWLGLFIDRCKDMGVFDNSVFAVISDHGHPIGEHGVVKKAPRDLHSILTKLVMMIRFPGGEYGGRRVNALVQDHDLTPTLLSALEVKPPESMNGIDLMPLIRGEARKVRGYAVTGCQQFAAIRNLSWLYITEAPDGKPALYDLKRDPEEKKNLFGQEKRKASQMADLLEKYAGEHS